MVRAGPVKAACAFGFHFVAGFLVHAVLFKSTFAQNAPAFYAKAVRADDDIQVRACAKLRVVGCA